MKKLSVIGIGPGNPEQITIQAIGAMRRAEVFFFLDKGESKSDLLHLRKEICERYLPEGSYRIVEVPDVLRDSAIASYSERVESWHQRRAAIYEELIERELGEDGHGAILVWGDPSLYDSTLRILSLVRRRGHIRFECEVIPGITSVQALAAGHKLILNEIGESIWITTGRKLRENGLPDAAENAVVMLDGEQSFRCLMGQNLEIYWGAYVGSDKEILLSGKLDDLADTIAFIRQQNRERHGWIMDIYMLRKREQGTS